VAGFLGDSQATDAAVLLLSELFTNAILHSASGLPGGLVTVTLRITSEGVRVDVVDQGKVPPGVAMPHGLGAGLVIVSELADVFGADGPDRWFMVQAACSLPVTEALERAERDAACDDGPEGDSAGSPGPQRSMSRLRAALTWIGALACWPDRYSERSNTYDRAFSPARQPA
jgi:hypothetical protein